MAAAPGLLLWLLLLGPPWRVPGKRSPAADRRFSEHKLCADDECSMLMYRGEALEDFTGPDCRFMNFKKGDTVYVYYKLSGRSPEVWAGSVGRIFGYFPKDLIQVVYEYTKEELQVPADETDFICFDGGRDDFDNYNVEELLGFLELDNSASGDFEKALEKTSQPVEKLPEVSEYSDPEPEPTEANSKESEDVFSENTQELRESFGTQKNLPHGNSQIDRAPGDQSLFEPFEEKLQDKLKVPESENNKTGNSSQVSDEQERIGAYTLLKKDMTLDLKTKFGSTADALVSDDETTRLVTSLEDDFDEELDEYYTVGKEEEENKENFDEVPLLTFIDAEDMKTPLKSEVEEYLTDNEQNSNEEVKLKAAQPPGIKSHDKNTLTTSEDTIFSVVTEGKEQIGVGLESSNSGEEKEGDSALVSDSKWRKPQSPTDHTAPKKAEEGHLTVELPKTNDDKDPQMDTEPHIIGKRNKAEESKRGLVQDGTDLEDEKREGRAVHSSTQSSNLNSLPAAEKHKETLKSAFDNKEKDLKGAAVHISKGVLHEVIPEEQILEGEIDLPRELEEEGPILGRNLSWQRERDVAAAVNKQMNEKVRVSEEEVKKDSSAEEFVRHQPVLGTQEVEPADQSDSTEVPGFPAEKPPAEDDGYSFEELLEDENAVSAKQSKEKSPEIKDRWLDVNLQGPERTIIGATNTDSEAEENKETSNILETGKKGETVGKGVNTVGKELDDTVVEKEESPLVDRKAQTPSEVSDFPDKKKNQASKIGEVSEKKDSDYLKENSPEEHLKASGLTKEPGVEELSEEDQGDLGKFMGTESQESASEEPEGDPFHWTPRTAIELEHSDLPIIGGFFKELQSLQRFQKYFDVRELEAMFQEMSLKLKLAQRESLPYNVEKVLDKVFRASESQILSVAEKMLYTRVAENRDLGMKENNILEEAAVLDDIQDLIYFVRYRHSTAEETVPLGTAQPPEEDWGGPEEEIQPPLEDNFPQDNTEDPKVQIPEEPSHLDQPVTSDTSVSEAWQKPDTEKDADPGIIITESTPLDPVDAKKQLETKAEEPASVTPLESAILLIYSFMFYLTKTVSLTYIVSSDRMLIISF
nr:transport and Golgi organization protein 1 homolog isoform X3 [Manis javanica]